MARCYDAIKSRNPSVRVMTSISPRGNDKPHARSNISHSPRNFIGKMGQAYRRSHRRARIFDAWGQNVYGSSSRERPWVRHRRDIGLGDYPRLLSYLRSAFGGTRQPIPGQKDVRIWYLEGGFQTGVGAKLSLYGKQRNRPRPRRAARWPGRSGIAADRCDQTRLLPAGRRRFLQLPAGRRTESARLAVGHPICRLDVQALLPGVQARDRRGQLASRRLREAQDADQEAWRAAWLLGGRLAPSLCAIGSVRRPVPASVPERRTDVHLQARADGRGSPPIRRPIAARCLPAAGRPDPGGVRAGPSAYSVSGTTT